MTSPHTQESREEQAKHEVGHTDFAPGVRWFLFALFFAVICGMPLLDQTLDWRDRRSPDTPFPRPQVFDLVDAVPARSEAVESLKREGVFRAGYLMNAKLLKGMSVYEDALEDGSRIAQWLLPPMQSLLIGRLGAGNEQAYCGRDGWLFYRPEIDYLTGPGFLDAKVLAARARRGDEWNPAPQPDPVKAILEFHDALAARGIALVLLPAPGKAMIYPEQFSSRYDGSRALENPSFAAFKEAVEARGVFVCETAPALVELKRRGTQSFLARDTHWSPHGAEEAARVLAAFLREKNLLPEREPAAYTRTETTVTNLGDIANMLNLPEDQTLYPEEPVTLRQVHTPDGTPWAPSQDADILFLGDSYANIYSLPGMGWGEGAGIIEQLSAELGRPADAILMNDNGAYATRRALSRELAQGKDRLAGKAVVVYEFAARELAVGDWKTGLTLELGARRASTAAEQAPLAADAPIPQLRVRATLKSTSTVPTPEDILPYTENLTVFEYQVDEVFFGACDWPTLYVAHWGVRDGKAVARTRQAKPGDTMLLTLERLDSHSDFEHVNRSDDAVRSFENPILYDAGGWALGTEREPGSAALPLELRMVDEREMAISTSSAGQFSDAILQERQKAIAAQRLELEERIEQNGGLSSWRAAIEPHLNRIRNLVAEQEAAVPVSPIVTLKDDVLASTGNLRTLFTPSYVFRDLQADAPNADGFLALVQLAEYLDRRGIHLILVPVPSRSSLIGSIMIEDYNGQYLSPAYVECLYELAKRGIEVVDLLPFLFADASFGADCVMKQDHHWSAPGIKAAANAITERLNRYVALFAPRERVAYNEKVSSVPFTSSYVKNLSEEQRAAVRVEPEANISQVLDGNGRLYEDDSSSPILLAGDSFVGHFSEESAGLAAHIARNLGYPLATYWRGGSATEIPAVLMTNAEKLLRSKAVVVLAFASHYLSPDWYNWDLTPGEESEEQVPAVSVKTVSGFGAFSREETAARAAAIQEDLQRVRRMAEAHGGWPAWEAAQHAVHTVVKPFLAPKDQPEFYFGKKDFLYLRAVDLPYCLAPSLGLAEPPAELRAKGARAPFEVITSLNEDLNRRNIHLIVVPIPPRAEVDPECLIPEGEGLDPEWVHPARMRLLEALLNAGTEVLDVLPEMKELKRQGKQASLRNESHFTPEAARAVAASVARRLRRYGVASDPVYQSEFSISETSSLVYRGVYASRYADIMPNLQPDVLPARLVQNSNKKPLKHPDTAPVLVVGDSYANVFEEKATDFVSQLSAELHMPVARIVSAGGGPKAPRALAQFGPEAFAQVRVVVWLFSARYLVPAPFLLREWQPVSLSEDNT